jgi:Na+/H+-dicarboxylate symporter
VLSLIASAVGSQEDLIDSFANVGYLILACCFGFGMQFLLVHVIIYYLVTRTNPFTYLKCIIPAQTMAFACASSAATIPMTLKSVRSTGIVPESVLRFVIPLGATVNMDGSAIYFPCACIWLAVLNGIEPNVAHYFLLVIIATIGSAGTAPVPSSGLVLIVTAYNTVFGTTGIPDGFSFVVAIDWFLDRCITVTNVTGDAMVCGMVSHLCPINDMDPDIVDGDNTGHMTKEVGGSSSGDEEVPVN